MSGPSFVNLSPRERVSRWVLHDGLDDWVPFDAVIAAADAEAPDDPILTLDWALGVTRQLAADGFVSLGRVDETLGWQEFDATTDTIDRLRVTWSGRTDQQHDFSVWLQLTQHGVELARSLESEWHEMVEDEAHRTKASSGRRQR